MTWRKLLAFLRKQYPVPNVRVRKRVVSGYIGFTIKRNGRFNITISKTHSFNEQVYALLEEWAHALTWDESNPEDHPDSWGVKYAEIYRSYLQWSKN